MCCKNLTSPEPGREQAWRWGIVYDRPERNGAAVLPFPTPHKARQLDAILPAEGLTGQFSFSKHRTSPQISRLHHPAQLFSQIRRNLMLVVQPVFCQNEFLL